MDHDGHLGAVRARRRPRALSPLREHLRDTFWFTPTVGLLGAAVAAAGVLELDGLLIRTLQGEGEYGAVSSLIDLADDTKTIITTVGSAMLTFIGVVFSISLVALQMASGQFSPRVVRLYVRSRITKCTFAVFLATFLFALLVQASYQGDTDPRTVETVPVFSSVTCVVMVLVSLVLFVVYVNSTLRLMRVSHVIDRITRESFQALERVGDRADPEPAVFGEATDEIAHRGRAGVLRDVHIARLVRVARRHGLVLRLIPRIGDFVVPGTPVLAVHGGPAPGRRALRYTVSVGVERTFHQDLGFGLRQLSDIAQRALSPAVNDPTTAVQCLDRIVQILAAVARRPLGALHHYDRKGAVRLVRELPGWTDLVDLGLAEIRGCAIGAPQVTRRLMAALDDLLRLAPEERHPPLVRHRTLLRQAVDLAVPEPADREFALLPDRQGIG
ncbi:hypothetical protein AF335_19190 [Streptomyces eurocidicus]|uniref:Putative membrane protein n=1 Tax=Streptomyces eurocidicus TaxID=66423 RepID=A0A2N8NV42_STREU|nr:DUF2254 domain-containing protein [Streptomyces eurocidicus]MBB5122488.1 putative membrane protein [Streptomyces eurocidicus]MBF6052105.1 DUF2254 domain-containing protein [Streptomyces eurocidicus]PNE32647.1 hypothetical protein AF335_19190 [Streptomyces eurocidicus]